MEVIWTKQFKKDVKSIIKRNKDIDKLQKTIRLLQNNIALPVKNKNHKLIGDFDGKWECHVEPDWLLIYSLKKDKIVLFRTGSHSDLF